MMAKFGQASGANQDVVGHGMDGQAEKIVPKDP
jgi:hypothetical protein